MVFWNMKEKASSTAGQGVQGAEQRCVRLQAATAGACTACFIQRLEVRWCREPSGHSRAENASKKP